jgi:hypothetical protein
MKKLAFALVFAVASTTAATAQVDFRAGPGGVGIGVDRDRDRGERTTVIRRDRGDWDRGDRTVVRRERGCRTIIVKERDDMGRRVTKRIERC